MLISIMDRPSNIVEKPGTRIRRRLNGTGIGFAGVDGVWWRPACEPLTLPNEVARQLDEIGQALFAFFDAISTLYKNGASDRLSQLLEFKVPDSVLRLVAEGRVDSLRPDFQLCPVTDTNSSYQLVVTELEICPSAHGFSHAMQFSYDQETDLVEAFASYLHGRELLFVGTQAWSEFLFEQLVFCRALAEVGVVGHVLYDLPLLTMADEIRQGERWQPPLFGMLEKPLGWNDDVIGRIHRHGLESFAWPDDSVWPAGVGDSVIFRFGYFDNFPAEKLQHFVKWEQQGAKLLNPLSFFLENKAMMAALSLPDVRQHLDEFNLSVLDRCIPETILLTQDNRLRLLDEREEWVVKYAAYDGGDQAWGGRSLEIGAWHNDESWQAILSHYLTLHWPTVAQRATPTARIDLSYYDREDNELKLRDGHTRLRTFFLRDSLTADPLLFRTIPCGSHVTVVAGDGRVSEGMTAVQAPVVFSKSE